MPPGQSPELFWLACYVMLTRCKDLSGLLILRLPPRSALKVGPPANVKAEMARLIGLASKTEQRLHKSLKHLLKADLPENISNLFSATSSSASTDVDWKHIEGQLAEEVAERQLHLTPSDPEPQSATPRRGPRSGPMKRSSKGASLPVSSGPRRRVTGKRSAATAQFANSSEPTKQPDDTTISPIPRGPKKRRTGEPSSVPPEPPDQDPSIVSSSAASETVPPPTAAGSGSLPDTAGSVPVRRGPRKRRTGEPSTVPPEPPDQDPSIPSSFAASETVPPSTLASSAFNAAVPGESAGTSPQTSPDASETLPPPIAADSVSLPDTAAVQASPSTVASPTPVTAQVQPPTGMPSCGVASAADESKRDLRASAASERIEREAARGIGNIAKMDAMKRRSDMAMKQQELSKQQKWKTTASSSSSSASPSSQRSPPEDPAPALPSSSSNSMPSVRVLELNSHLSEQLAVRIDEALGYVQQFNDVALTWQCGQRNLGNTCYANSLLMAIASVPALRAWILQHATLHDAPDDTHCLLCTVAEDVRLLAASPCKQCIQPATVQSRRQWCPQFATAAQQDVCEFWTKLADSCNTIDRNSYSDLVGPLHAASAILYTTPYWKRCGWRGHTKTTCSVCGFCTVNHQYLDHLTVPFPPGRNADLKNCLRQYFASELLPAPDRCEDGCQGIGCRKKSTITEVWPEVLCIQVKRWLPTLIPGLFQKERRDLDIPILLDHFEGGPSFEYVLCSAIIHDGHAGGGHYFTLFRPTETGAWMLADDSSVTVYTGNVNQLLKQVFLMFYAKKSVLS
jgi:ubiquitin C-terminal hydrolase